MSRTMTFDELSLLIKKSEEIMREKESQVIAFYEKYLEHEPKFTVDIFKTLSGSEALTRFHAVSPEPTLYEILLYTYFIPWNFFGNEIPHFSDNDKWENWYYQRKLNKKEYYGKIKINDNRDSCVGALNISEFIRKNADMLNAASDSPKTEEILLRDTLNNIVNWGAAPREPVLGGSTLISFPLISMLSVVKKKSFFLLDLGIELFATLQTVEQENEPPLIIPKNILGKQIVGFSRRAVEAEVEYDASTENIHLKSSKYHTVFDVISLASELSDIENEEERIHKINTAIDTIKSESRTFSNITAKDFSALSNILKLFYKDDNTASSTLDIKLGELSNAALAGIADRELEVRKKDCILDTLEIVHKWASYTFDLGTGNHGINGGRFNVISYVSGEYTDAKVLADAIRTGKIQGQLLLPGAGSPAGSVIEDKEQGKDYLHLSFAELCEIPVTLELSAIFRKSIEHDQMTRQFSYYYEQLSDANAQAIYSFIEHKRQEANYPPVLHLTYDDFKKFFVVELRKKAFLKIIDRTVAELLLLGAIKEYHFSDIASAYSLKFD